ncbi:MAG: TaqI-like C-terminal specificity domain-containing protein [Anaerolineales bacterium]|nr:TaqI-like C-terminal specificity domain-containing protein [Anaerolineales bacterium]
MTAPDSIRQLVERFELHRDAYRAGKYNETQLRREFLDPFFEALGWDVFNKLGYSEENKHVIHEDSLEIEGAKKAPDYAFKVGKERKFFVEAKKPSVRIETNPEVAFQLKRYVWSAKLPLGILTDFEEFAIYECRSKPKVSDSVKTGRVMLLNYSEYIEKWDEIVSIFSHDAVMTGKFDKFANSAAKKKGTAEVDSAFLAEIEGWREALAKNVALRNKLRVKSEADLNYAVQMTIDRMIFLRICEERGYESEYQLQELSKRENVYAELKKLFEKADKRYNSGLFHFRDEKGRGQADTFTTGLEIDDKVLKDIIKDLYYPSPYVFALIPADILGQIYEQFLGKVIRLTASGNAKVEEKPEVRKAGGVYYTPTFIVDYIVGNTVGRIANPTYTPKEAARLKILDPACGSGTFLLGAYQYLLDWHLNWYINNDPEKWSKGKNPAVISLPQLRSSIGGGQGGGWKLSVEKKKEILLNNIYGVDIDPQAVEVTKLSLLLKVIEDPGQLSLLDERILPDLGRNIQCGNSLIGPDYWDGQLMVDEEERARVNAFDWKAAFPEVFAQGGFDAVVGNPPYVRPHNLEPEAKEYYWRTYKSFVKKSDLYSCFIEKSVSLLKPNGLCSFIVSNGWLRLDSFEELRKLLLDKTSIKTIIEFEDMVFDATVKTLIFVLSNGYQRDNYVKVATTQASVNLSTLPFSEIAQDDFKKSYKHIFDLSIDTQTEQIKQKMVEKAVTLGSAFSLAFGLKTGDDDLFLGMEKKTNQHKPLLRGANVHRYERTFAGEYVWYVPEKMTAHKKTARPGTSERFEQPKVLIRDTGGALEGTYDDENFYVKDVLVVTHSTSNASLLKYLCGILNSRLMKFYYETSFPTLHVQRDELASLPIVINFSDPAEKAQHNKMVSLVERMLALQKSLKSTHNPQEADRLTREVSSVDKAIDGLVYELYGLSEDEVKIVEGK